MLLNANINNTYQKMICLEAVNMCKRIRNSRSTSGSTTTPFEIFMEKNQKSLVRSWNLNVLAASLNRKFSRNK